MSFCEVRFQINAINILLFANCRSSVIWTKPLWLESLMMKITHLVTLLL